jgi:iron complex outermembrane receptor protein
LADGCISRGPSGAPGSINIDCSGKVLPRAPKFSGNARYAHKVDIAGGGALDFGATARGASLAHLQINYSSPNFRQEAYMTFDADVTYRSPNDRWSLGAWIRNIANKAVYQQASNAGSVNPPSRPLRASVTGINDPRTFGARFQLNF